MDGFDWNEPQEEPVIDNWQGDDDGWGIPQSPTTEDNDIGWQDDGWGIPTESSSTGSVNTQSEESQHIQDTIDIFETDSSAVQSSENNSSDSQKAVQALFNLSIKSACFVLAGILFIIFIILIVINSIKIQPKQQVQTTINKSSSTTQVTKNNGVNLMEVPEGTNIDYNGAIYTATGTVSNKKAYLQGTQVVYCIDISLQVGASTQIVKHYCNYNVYNQIAVGTLLTVQYQQVSQTCLSVNAVTY